MVWIGIAAFPGQVNDALRHNHPGNAWLPASFERHALSKAVTMA